MSSESPREFHRIRRLPPYVFAEVNSAKGQGTHGRGGLIDLGMGNPDSRRRANRGETDRNGAGPALAPVFTSSAGIPGWRRRLPPITAAASTSI